MLPLHPLYPAQIDKLWNTYHHIAKLQELGTDERGNSWNQGVYSAPAFDDVSYDEIAQFRPADEVCHTRMCFAGWYAHLNGVYMDQRGYVRIDNATIHVANYVSIDSGIPCFWTGALFDAFNDLNGLRQILTSITGVDRS